VKEAFRCGRRCRSTGAARRPSGPCEYEVRRYPGWCRHITLAMPAHPFLDALLPRPTPRLGPVAHALNWPLWRRRHQAAARHCHYRRRTSSGNDF
jgi:hypothetical protein